MHDPLEKWLDKRRRGDVPGYWLYLTADPDFSVIDKGKSWYPLPKEGQLWRDFKDDWVLIVECIAHYREHHRYREAHYMDRSVFSIRWPNVHLDVKILRGEEIKEMTMDIQTWHLRFKYPKLRVGEPRKRERKAAV